MRQIREWQTWAWRRSIDLIFPPKCPLTEQEVYRQGSFSPEIWSDIQHITPPWCDCCGLPFSDEQGAGTLCAACAAPDKYEENLTGKGKLTQLRSALIYNDAIAPGILKLKYADRYDGVAAYARLMTRATQNMISTGTEILVPVPLHESRLRDRKYNQAGLLATALSHETGLTVRHDLLKRKRSTPSQKGSSRSERTRHVAGAFVADPKGMDLRPPVILIDDVMTTGATLLACAKALRKAGFQDVRASTLARVVKSLERSLYDRVEGEL